jgi:hypothetical protein
MEDILSTDTIEAKIEELTDPGTFDVLEFVQATVDEDGNSLLPDDEVVIFRDRNAGTKLANIYRAEKERNEKESSEGIGLADEYEDYADEDEIAELRKRVLDSALTFTVQALAPAAVKAIEKKMRATHEFKEGADNKEYYEDYNGTVIAKSIAKVVNAKGQVDPKTWDAKRVLKFNESIADDEFNKLFSKVWELNFTVNLFDEVVNADF